jgi:GntR family transcriptional regulator
MRPQHLKIAATLRAEVLSGWLTPGAQLPSISQLIERFETSNATVQRALEVLRDEGFLQSRPGKGVFVRDRKPFLVRTAAYFDPADRGVTYSVLEVATVTPPPDVANALREDRAVLRNRLMLRDGSPVEVSWSYYPASIALGSPLAKRGRIRGGAPQALADLGFPERRFEDQVSARVATPDESDLLALPDEIPVLRQLRTIYSDDDRPVEVSVIVMGAHLYELSYVQTIPKREVPDV